MGFWDALMSLFSGFGDSGGGDYVTPQAAAPDYASLLTGPENYVAAPPAQYAAPVSAPTGMDAANVFQTSNVPYWASATPQQETPPPNNEQIPWGRMLAQAGVGLGTNLLAGGTTAMLNNLFGQKPQQTLRTTDVRTPQQSQMDAMRLGTYQQLANDYTAGQKALPLWNPVEEDHIRRTTLAEAARSGVQDSGQAMAMVNRNLQGYRMNVAQQHEQNQIQRAGQLAGGAMGPGMNVTAQNIPLNNPFQMSQIQPMGMTPPSNTNDTYGKDANKGQPVTTTQKNPLEWGYGQ